MLVPVASIISVPKINSILIPISVLSRLVISDQILISVINNV